MSRNQETMEVRKGGVGHNPVADVYVTGPVDNPRIVPGAEIRGENGATTPAETSADTRNLLQRLRDAQAAAKGLAKRGKAPAEMGGFAFIQDADVQDTARDLLMGNGITVIPSMRESVTEQVGTTKSGKPIYRTKTHIAFTLVNVDSPTERETFDWWGHADDNNDKGDGKAGTSTVKNALMKLLLLQGDPSNDPDGADPTGGEGRAEHAQQRRPAPRPETPADHAREAGKAAAGGAEANRVKTHGPGSNVPPIGQLFGPCPECGEGRVKAEWIASKNKMIAVCSLRDYRDKSTCQYQDWAPDWLRIEAASQQQLSADGQPPIEAYDESEIPF